MSNAAETQVSAPGRPESRLVQMVGGIDRLPVARWCFLVGLACTVLSGNSGLLGLPISPDRLLIPLALLLILLDPRRPQIRWRPVHAVMAFYVFWALWSMVSHDTISVGSARFAFLDRILIPLVLFLVAPLLFPTMDARRDLTRMLTVLGAWLALNTIFEMFGPSALVWPRYILDAVVDETATRRAQGPFLAAEALGMVLLFTGFAAMVTIARDTRAWRRFASVVSPLCFLSSILSMTRSVWLGAILAIVIAVMTGSRLRRSAAVVIAAVVAGALVVMATLPEMVEDFFSRLGMSSSLYDRANTNAAALRIIAERPVEGIGWGRFILDGATWVRQAPDYPLTNVGIEVHNMFLSRAAELGIPGALAFIACLVLGPLWILQRMRRTESREWWAFAAASFAIWLVPALTSPNPYPTANYLLWLVSGIAGTSLLTVRTRNGSEPLAAHHSDGAPKDSSITSR